MSVIMPYCPAERDKIRTVMKQLTHIWIVTLLLSFTGTAERAAAADYQLDTVFETDGVVWSFAFLSPSEMLAVRRDGKLFYTDFSQNIQRELPAPSVVTSGQGGLLDVHIHDEDDVRYIYLTYSTEVDDGDATTALARGEWRDGTLQKLETLFVADTEGDSGRHFGSRLLFHGGHIYMTIGDRTERDYAQDLSVHNGKILRLDARGRAARDNPFSQQKDALPEIWSYGHRNSQGIDYERDSGKIYSAEFGPRGGDELNLIERGKNYGWPVITYGREYWGPSIGDTHAGGMEQPVAYWTPSISPSGMAFYYGDKIPQWRGSLFLANLSSQHLRRLVFGENGKVTEQEVLFDDLDERFRHVRESPDGYLYFSTDSGRVVRVSLP